MAFIFKCKCCTGNLDVTEGTYIVECDYCGTKQTVPSSRDENIQNLFNRATTLRLKSEFDKAESIYERIIQADEEQSEAYWGLILCKFGVEYVEDPKTFKRIPTCHRTSFESVIADENYKLTLQYAYEGQKALYEEEAKAIDKVQKGILAVAQNEDPYDVFICYKETDENGKRTPDSVIANDIYYQLKQEGFKVFYAAITLEGKLGSAYEPIIFAALNSAKVMLAIGTKPEYFNAVWVKNEWSRFLKMNKDDRSKLLIPCYKGMDAYDLPDEFAHLQAQDMGKIGFINDIVRGIKKVINKKQEKTAQPAIAQPTNAQIGNLVKRANLALEDKEFDKARAFSEQILNIDVEYAQAYVIALLCDFEVTSWGQLGSCADIGKVFENGNYKKALRFATPELKTELEDLEKYYTLTKIKEMDLLGEKSYLLMKQKLKALQGFKPAEECLAKLDDVRDRALVKHVKNLLGKQVYEVDGYINAIKNETTKTEVKNLKSFVLYEKACKLMENKDYYSAKANFLDIVEYKDAKSRIEDCDALIAREAQMRAEEYRRKQELIARKKRKERIKLFVSLGVIVLIIASIPISCGVSSCVKEKQAQQAQQDMAARNGCKLTLLDGYYAVSGLEDKSIEKLEILSTYKGKPVKYILQDAFYNCDNLKSVTIPDSITGIGESAFEDCDNLKSVTIGDSVTFISNKMFYSCGALESVTIGKGVTKIGEKAFFGCRLLANIVIPENVTAIGYRAFYNCLNLSTVVVEDTANWYWTKNEIEWKGKYGGTYVDLSNVSKNAVYLQSYDYWYKL